MNNNIAVGNLYLCIDQGGSSSRVIIFNDKASIIAQHQISVKTTRHQKFVEQNPQEIVESITQCLECGLAKLSNEQRIKICAASLITQRSSFVAFDTKTAQCLSKVISWQDTRGDETLNELQLDNDWLNKKTGLRKNAHFGAIKMRWCLQNIKAVQEADKQKTLKFLPLASFLVKQLTNKKHYMVDPANAARTLLMNIETLSWDQELLNKFNISPLQLPFIQENFADYGELIFPHLKIPLQYVSGDQSAAIFAQGIPLTSQLMINIGTGAFVSNLNTKRLVDDTAHIHSGLLQSIVHSAAKQKFYVTEATINGAGSALEIMANKLGIALNTLQKPTTESNIPIFINTLGGLAAPYWRTDIPAHFIGEGNNNSKLWAVLESIAFLISQQIGSFSQLNKALKTINLSGGLSNNMNLCKMIATLNPYIVTLNEEKEASARGSIWHLMRNQKTSNSLVINNRVIQKQKDKDLTKRYLLWQKQMQAIIT